MENTIQEIVDHLSVFIAVVGGLGLVAQSVVDSLKLFGFSSIGFSCIETAVHEASSTLPCCARVSPPLCREKVLKILKSHWINGMPLEEQKKLALELIVNVSADKGGEDVPAGKNGFVKNLLDAGYEQADQFYRNGMKLSSAIVAVGLAVLGDCLLLDSCLPALCQASSEHHRVIAFIIGLLAVPLAPVSKDAVSILGAAAKGRR